MHCRKTKKISDLKDLKNKFHVKHLQKSFKLKNLLNIKTIFFQPSSYCFVEFKEPESARNAMLSLNGRSIPNDTERSRFNLSFANSPNP